jgi:hypothetical protein
MLGFSFAYYWRINYTKNEGEEEINTFSNSFWRVYYIAFAELEDAKEA